MTTFEILDGDFTGMGREWPRKYPWIPGEVVTSETFTRAVHTGYLTDAKQGGGRWPYLSVVGASVEGGKLRAPGETSIAFEFLPFDCKIEVGIEHRPATSLAFRMWANYLRSKYRLDYLVRQTDSRITQSIDGVTTPRATGLEPVNDGDNIELTFQGNKLTVHNGGVFVGEGTATPSYPFDRRVFEIFTGGVAGDALIISSIKVTAV